MIKNVAMAAQAVVLSESAETTIVNRISRLWDYYNLETGVNVIDIQHIWLMRLVLMLEWLLFHEENIDIKSAIDNVLEEAAAYAEEHFKAEEMIYDHLNYAEAKKHNETHEHFTGALKKLVSGKAAHTEEGAEKLYRFLRHWLIHHINVEDRKYADFINRRKIVGQADEYADDLEKKGVFSLRNEQKELYQQITAEGGARTGISRAMRDEIAAIWNRFNLLIDVPLVDIQHVWLIKLVVELDYALKESPMSKIAVFSYTIEEAVKYIKDHFRTEEALMKKLNYPDLDMHIAKHRDFVNAVMSKKGEFEAGNHREASNMVRTLKDWLYTHIAIEDKKFAALCRQHHQTASLWSKQLIQSGKADLKKKQVNLYRSVVLE